VRRGGGARDGGVDSPFETGLRRNWKQFALLVVVNAFVGSVVGTERTLLPLLGSQVFGIASSAAILSFLVSFGLVKAIANATAGYFSDVHGRRQILLVGWIVGIPVPFFLMFTPPPHWWLIVLANGFLGVNQGLCWSMTVVSKIDLVGSRRRGLATGLNEFAGYAAVGGTALLTSFLAGTYGIRAVPFAVGLAAIGAGLILSAGFVRETKPFAERESAASGARPTFRSVFAEASWRNRSLFACSQGGLVNNLNDGIAWGLLPLFLVGRGLATEQVGLVTGLYPISWGFLQLLTGPASDRIGRKPLIVAGMWVQAIGFVWFVAGNNLLAWAGASLLLGLGTAMVYPTYLAAVSDLAPPEARGATVGVYRFWRDLGFAVGAVVVGLFADARGLDAAMVFTGALTFASGAVAFLALRETRNP